MPDPLEMPGGQPRMFVSVGGQRRPVTDGTLRSSMSDRSDASFTIDLRHLAAVDLTSPVQLTMPSAEASQGDDIRFTGHIVTAVPTDAGTLSATAESGRELVESAVGLLHASDVSGPEMIYLVARQGGLPSDRIQIQGLLSVPHEVFVVEMPVVGLSVSRVVLASGVEFVPVTDSAGRESFGPFSDVVEELASRWGMPTARARTYVTGQLMYEAEREATDRIEHALNALLATATYGLSRDPWGRDLPFDRSQLRARPSAIPVVYSQGVASQRRWIHSLAGDPVATLLDVGSSFERWSQLIGRRPSVELERALRAIRDASDERRDPYDRCHAVCTVLEYYSASSKPPPVVSKAARKAAVSAVKAVASNDVERRRLAEVVERVNTPPLMARVRHQVEQDGTPMSDQEWELLARLRAARNDSVHGRSRHSSEPDMDELRWGLSIAARLLMYRWSAETPAT